MFSGQLGLIILEVELTPFGQLIDNKASSVSGLTSKIYKMLNTEQCDKQTSFQKAWIRDCGNSALVEKWLKVWSSNLWLSRSTEIKWMQYKLITRWYLTPFKLSLIYSGSPFVCWKGCGE